MIQTIAATENGSGIDAVDTFDVVVLLQYLVLVQRIDYEFDGKNYVAALWHDNRTAASVTKE